MNPIKLLWQPEESKWENDKISHKTIVDRWCGVMQSNVV